MSGAGGPRWYARGLLFENCNCQVVCPGHVHFSQLCTHERCLGYWGISIREGELEGVALGGLRVVIAYDSPRHMIEGGWTQRILVDEAAPAEQRAAVERIVRGEVGGPWAVLARFVERWEETRAVRIAIEDEGGVKRLVIEGVAEGTVEPIRGRDRSQPVTFENMFNQIHAASQVVARGSSRYDDGAIAFRTEGTHGLYSTFSWEP